MPIKTRPGQREARVASGPRRARKLSLHRETIGRLANDGPDWQARAGRRFGRGGVGSWLRLQGLLLLACQPF